MHRLPLALAAAMLTPMMAAAQNETSIRFQTIQWPEIEVRSGPSLKFPATGTLRKGAQVVVRGRPTVDGFLEIQPPAGSVSWIPKAVITKMGNPIGSRQAFHVDGDAKDDPVPVRPGGPSLTDGPLPIDTRFTVPRGTQGYIRGNPVKASWGDTQWYPIDPMRGESRWIPAASITDSKPDALLAKGSAGGTAGQLTSLPARDATELFRKAQKAEQAGDVQGAIELYQQVSREVSATNDSLANFCATRVYELRQRRTNLAPGTLAGRTANSSPGPGEPPLPGSRNFERPPQSPAAPATLRSTGMGFLRRAGFAIDNKSAYALIDRNREVIWYVTAEPGINLESYVDRWVDLQGISEVRGDVRGGDYMRVAKVMLVR